MYHNGDNMEETEEKESYFYTSDFLQFKYQISLIMANNNINISNKTANLLHKVGFTTEDIKKFNKDDPYDNMHVSINKEGLGYTKTISEYTSKPGWNYDMDEIEVCESVIWLQNNNAESFSCEECLPIEGPKITYVDGTEFCDFDVFHQVFKEKGLFDKYDHSKVYNARYRSNPFETIKSAIFMNRAALKMASIDAATDFMFTNMDKQKSFSLPIYFADVCAGPGGFSEYLFWRRRWDYKGFGLTLAGPDDFKLQDSKSASFITFQALYGKYGDGDVCNPENISDFVDKVRNETGRLGVHFVMSDGGFSVKGREELQEVASKNIYLCQCYLALEMLRPHGSFVTKIFDVFTPFSVGLLYLMYSCFEQVSILKPNTSRPANSERYFICDDLRDDARTHNIRQYLSSIVEKMWIYGDSPEKDVLELVPLDVIKKDSRFFEYICNSNKRIARKQINAFTKLATFCENPFLSDPRQSDLKEECLKYWKVPARLELDDDTESAETLESIFKSFQCELNRDVPRLNGSKLMFTLRKMNDYLYCFLSDTEEEPSAKFYFAINNKVYEISKTNYSLVENTNLVNNTLIYGELVKEYQDDGTLYRDSLHIIDAITLGEINLEGFTFNKRLELIERYCKALNKESTSILPCRIRPKIFKNIKDLKSELPSNKETPFNVELPTLGYKSSREIFKANSVLLYTTENEFLGRFHNRYVVSNNKETGVNFEKLFKALL